MEDVFHVMNKSISNFIIFNDDEHYNRIINLINYYQIKENRVKYSEATKGADGQLLVPNDTESEKRLVDVIAYCIMPTHLHIIVRAKEIKNVSSYLGRILNGYTRYFNIKHNRKGPLWEGRSKKVSIKSDNHLLHVTRYLHLNPVTAFLVDKPDDWRFSSYNEYTRGADYKNKICRYDDILDIVPEKYEQFVRDNINYQRELSNIKKLTLEDGGEWRAPPTRWGR